VERFPAVRLVSRARERDASAEGVDNCSSIAESRVHGVRAVKGEGRRCVARSATARRAGMLTVMSTVASHGTTRRGDQRGSTCSIGDAVAVSLSATTTAPPRATYPSSRMAWCSAPSRSRMMNCSRSSSTRRYTHTHTRDIHARKEPRSHVRSTTITYRCHINFCFKSLVYDYGKYLIFY